MHIAEGLLPIRQAVTYGLAVSPFLYASTRRLKKARDFDSALPERAFAGVAAALCFAMTVLPIPVPVAGATSHMCATLLLGLFFGPLLMILPVFLVLVLQALFFAHGGITSLGVNTLTLGICGPYLAYFLTRIFIGIRLPVIWSVGIACFVGDLFVYFIDSVVLGFALANASFSRSVFYAALFGFLPVQLPLALLEGVLSALLVKSLRSRRPEFLPSFLRPTFAAENTIRPIETGTIWTACVLATLFIACGPSNVHAATFQGMDDSLFARLAREAGRSHMSPFIDFEQRFGPEVWQFCVSIAYLIAGFMIGRFWQKYLARGRTPGRAAHASQ